MKFRDRIVTALSYVRRPEKRKLISLAFTLKGKTGLEVGGPSRFFGLRGGFPAYLVALRVDGVNFSTETIWEGNIQGGRTYAYFPGKLGNQFIAEATELAEIPAGQYDFVLSCHSLEHIANPIKALKEWRRVMKTGAMLVLVLPDKRFTFDLNRPYTSFEHLSEDFDRDMDEHDTTHFDEIVRCQVNSMDPVKKTSEDLLRTLKDNFTNRMAHHHVFSQGLVHQVLNHCGFEVIYQQEMAPFHMITVATKN